MKKILKKCGLLVVSILLIVACNNTNSHETTSKPTTMIPHESPAPPAAVDTSERIPNELVCMVNNAFMGIPQIPVKVGEKTYFGCCDQCEKKLKDSEVYRYAKDPLTGAQVDKANAYIVLAVPGSYQVAYFASEKNFKAYKGENQ